MNTSDKDEVQKQTEQSKEQAIKEAIANKNQADDNEVIHSINPFTGTPVDITPEDLEGIEKQKEAQTERD